MQLVEEKKKQKAIAPEGPAQSAICISVVELGSQMDYKYDNERRICVFNVGFELPDSRFEYDGSMVPLTVYRKMWINMDPYSMGKSVKRYIGNWVTDYDRLAKEGKTLQQVLLGRPALVTVAHKEGPQGVSARVEDIGACPAKLATTLPDPHNEPWSYDPADPDTNWDRLPPWQQEEVRNSIEFKEGGQADETDDANM